MSNTALGFPFGFFTNDNLPQDAKYFNRTTKLPYTNVAEATNSVLMPPGIRHQGLTVNIAGEEYWWRDGIANNQLIKKTVDLTGYVPFTGSTTNVVLGGQLTTPQINFASSYINGNGEAISLFAIGGANPTHAFFDKGLRFYNGVAYADIKSENITGTWSIQVPNASGTLALTTDCQAPLSGTGIVKSASGSISYINGVASQYIRGDGTLASFPTSTGGGSSVNYYLNGSISQGTFGGATYYQMSKTPVLGAGTGTDFIRTHTQGDGYIASFITDAGDPSLLNIPGGNWNVEFYFESNSTGGSPKFYGEIYKVSATNVFTLVGTGSVNPESITNGTTVDQYFTSIPVTQTTLLVTDRIAIRIYVITSGKTITLHTENGNLCEVITTFSTGLTALNGLTRQVQYFDKGTTGTDFNIVSTTDTHVFHLPIASAANTGKLLAADWSEFKAKLSALSLTTGFIPKATGVSTLADSQIQDNGTTLGIGGISTLNKLTIIDTALAGTGLTGSLLDLQQTWNTTGNPTAIKLTVTNTQSGTAALFLNCLLGTSSVFNINKFGDVGSIARIGSITSNRIGIVTNTATASQSILSGSSFSHATGSSRSYYSTDGFVSSGAAEFAFLEYGGTINQTGGTGITRGLYINPSTFTSVADFRAIETTKGAVYLANTVSGTSVPSLLNLTQTFASATTLSNIATFNYLETGSGSTSSSGFMRFNLNGAAALTILKTGSIFFGAAFGASGISAGNPITGASTQGGAALNMYHNLSGATVGYGFYMRNLTLTRQPTTDESGILNLFDTFDPTTGTASHNAITIKNTINQTAGVATGITRGLYVNPILTSAADYRAIEVPRGSIVFPYQAVSATYAIKTSDYLLDFTSGTFTATLPTAVGCTGKTYVLKNSGTGVITIATTSSQTIDGATTITLATQYSTITVVSNGANWITKVNSNAAFINYPETTYTGTINWTATVAPSGTADLKYRASQSGKSVTVRISGVYATSGTMVSSVSVQLPTALPAPETISGFTGAGDFVSVVQGTILTNTGQPTTSGAGLFKSGANYNIIINVAAGSVGNANSFMINFTYLTN